MIVCNLLRGKIHLDDRTEDWTYIIGRCLFKCLQLVETASLFLSLNLDLIA